MNSTKRVGDELDIALHNTAKREKHVGDFSLEQHISPRVSATSVSVSPNLVSDRISIPIIQGGVSSISGASPQNKAIFSHNLPIPPLPSQKDAVKIRPDPVSMSASTPYEAYCVSQFANERVLKERAQQMETKVEQPSSTSIQGQNQAHTQAHAQAQAPTHGKIGSSSISPLQQEIYPSRINQQTHQYTPASLAQVQAQVQAQAQQDPSQSSTAFRLAEIEKQYLSILKGPCSFSQILRLEHAAANSPELHSPRIQQAIAQAMLLFAFVTSHPVSSPSVVFGSSSHALLNLHSMVESQRCLDDVCTVFTRECGIPVATSQAAVLLIQQQQNLQSYQRCQNNHDNYTEPENNENNEDVELTSALELSRLSKSYSTSALASQHTHHCEYETKLRKAESDTYYSSIASRPLIPSIPTSSFLADTCVSSSSLTLSSMTSPISDFSNLRPKLLSARARVSLPHRMVYEDFIRKRRNTEEISPITIRNDETLNYNILPLPSVLQTEARLGYDAFLRLNLNRVQRGARGLSPSTDTNTNTNTTTEHTTVNIQQNNDSINNDIVVPLHSRLGGDTPALRSIPLRTLSDGTQLRSVEILDLLVLRERLYSIDPLFLTRHRATVNCRMRAILIDWLCEVANEFLLGREAFHLTIALLDRYLSVSGRAFLYIQRQKIKEGLLSPTSPTLIDDPLVPDPVTGLPSYFPSDAELEAVFGGFRENDPSCDVPESGVNTGYIHSTRPHGSFAPNDTHPRVNPYTVIAIDKDNLQLLGISCLSIATKIDEVFVPSHVDLSYTTDNAYTTKQIKNMEKTVLGTLGWFIHPPTASTFSRLYLKLLAQYSAEVHEIFVPSTSPSSVIDPRTTFSSVSSTEPRGPPPSGMQAGSKQPTFAEYLISPSLALQSKAFETGYIIDEQFLDENAKLLAGEDLPHLLPITNEEEVKSGKNNQFTHSSPAIVHNASLSYIFPLPQCDQSSLLQPTELERKVSTTRNKHLVPPPSAFTASHRWYRLMELLDVVMLDSEHVFIPSSSLACAAIALVYPESRLVCPWIFNRPRLAPALIFVSRFVALPFAAKGVSLSPYFDIKITAEGEHTRQTYHKSSLPFALDIIEGFPRFSFALSERVVNLWNEGSQHPKYR